MAEQKCPMCGNPNPEGVEVCEHCGARLVPLDLTRDSGAEDPGDNWLDRMRAEASAEEPEEEEFDWEDFEASELPQQVDEPEPEPDEEPEEPVSLGFDVAAAIGFEPQTGDLSEPEVPEWLQRIRQKQADEAEAAGEDELDLRAAFAQDQEVVGEVEDAKGDKFAPRESLARDQEAADEAEAPAEDDFDLRAALMQDREAADEAEDSDFDRFAADLTGEQDFVSDLRGLVAEEQTEDTDQPPSEPEPSEAELELDSEAQPSTAEPETPVEHAEAVTADAGWLSETAEPAPAEPAWPAEADSEEPEPPPESAPAEPSWLSETPEAEAAEPEGPLGRIEEPPAEPAWQAEASETPQAEQETRADVPQPSSALEPSEDADEELAEAELPGWMREVGPEPGFEGPLPHVQALIGEEPEASEAEGLGLPDWLGEIEPSEPGSGPEPDTGPDLAPATLPNWLEAMRPVDTFRSVVKIDAEEDQSIESVGPLAGLRGVLNAEPVVAMPRTSTVGSMQLEVSERQYAQAELLHKLIAEEELEQPAKPRRRVRLALFRWVIAAVTLIAVLLPITLGAPSFPLTSQEPQELGPLFDLVRDLPDEQPALMVYDFDPGYSGELDAVSAALIDQVMGSGIPVASLSTRPTGSPLAVRATENYAIRHGYQLGQDIVHLGYLSGGSTAVQLFSADPRAAVLGGFGLPEQYRAAGVWDTPVLQAVNQLSDFGMVAVITSGPEIARAWIEQAKPHMGDTPLLMIVSAGVEPLVRPYFETTDPQVDGILTGLPAATAYEQRNGRLGPAQARWNAFGAGILASELVLIAGVGYGVVRWWLGRRAS